MRVIILLCCLSSLIVSNAQNVIKIRKSDTTFNAFYYSEEKVSSVNQNNGRSYYIFCENGSIFFFNNTSKFKKFKKQCDVVDWTNKKHPDGKYYINGSEVLIFPYIMNKTGGKELGATSLNGEYHLDRLVMNSGSKDRVMIKLE